MKTKTSINQQERINIQAFCDCINAHGGWLNNVRTSTSKSGVKWIHIEGGYNANRKIEVSKSWITERDEVTPELIEAIRSEIQTKQ